MASDWSVLHYGKLMGLDGGILPKSGFTITETSVGFPNELKVVCDPAVVGVTDQVIWERFQLRGEQATLALRPVHAGGQWYLHAVRLRIRGEGANGQSGRYFHQTAHLLLPVSQMTDPTDLWGLPRAAKNGLPTDRRNDLNAVRVSSPDINLQPGWFDDRLQSLLAAIVAGHGMLVYDPNLEPDAAFELALRCLACLPAAVRWRVPVGAGFFDTPRQWGFAHGQKVSGQVKWLDGKLKLSDGVSLAQGEEYVEWVRSIAESARSVGALMRSVDGKFNEISSVCDLSRWDGLGVDGELLWVDAVKAVAEAIPLLVLIPELGLSPTLLQKSLVPPSTTRPAMAGRSEGIKHSSLRRFGRFVVDALRLILRAARRRGTDNREGQPRPPRSEDQEEPTAGYIAFLLNESLTLTYADMWAKLAAEDGPEAQVASTLGLLAGILQPFELSRIHADYAVLLPVALIPSAVGRLQRAVNQVDAVAKGWAELVQAAGQRGAAPVLRAWRQSDEIGLVWLGLVLGTPGRLILDAWDAEGLGTAFHTAREILAGYTPNLAQWASLSQSVPSFATEFAAELERQLFAGLREIPSAERAYNVSQLVQLLRDTRTPARLCRPLVFWWNELEETDRRQVRGALDMAVSSGAMTPAFAYLLFNLGAPTSAPQLRLDEEAVIDELVTENADIQARLLGWSGAWSARWLNRLLYSSLSVEHPQLTLIRSLYRATLPNPIPGTSLAEAEVIASVVAQCPRMTTVQPRFSSVSTLDQLRTCAGLLESQFSYWFEDTTGRFAPEIMIEAATDSRAEAFWQARFVGGGTTKREVFRLFTPPNASPTSTEERLLLDLPDAAFLRYLLGFENVTIPLYGRLLVCLSRTNMLTTQQVIELAECARKTENSILYDALLRAVERLRYGADRLEWNKLTQELVDRTWPSHTRAAWQQYVAGQKSPLPAPLMVRLRSQSTNKADRR